jgi:hypothetical protein
MLGDLGWPAMRTIYWLGPWESASSPERDKLFETPERVDADVVHLGDFGGSAAWTTGMSGVRLTQLTRSDTLDLISPDDACTEVFVSVPPLHSCAIHFSCATGVSEALQHRVQPFINLRN